MEWGEAIRLLRILRDDPSSRILAAVEGWSYPLSHEGWMLADLIDVQGSKAMGKKWKAYRRPVKPKDVAIKRRGDTAGRTRSQVIEILRKFGHGAGPAEQNGPAARVAAVAPRSR